MSVSIRELNPLDESAFLKGAAEWPPEDLTWFTFDWKPGTDFTEHLERLRKNKLGLDLPQGFVPSTMLYAFNDAGEIVGRVSIRHELNAHLRERGGHIGYSVAERFRRRGYGAALMRAGLDYCRNTLGLSEVLVTCADSNTASWKIIESAGGVLRDKVMNDGELARQYTLDLR